MPRWAAKVDGNHQAAAEMLAACGWTVVSLARLGGGVPDLLLAKGDRVLLAEVKTATGKLNEAQIKFRLAWPGEYWIIRTWGDVDALNRSGQAPAPAHGDEQVPERRA